MVINSIGITKLSPVIFRGRNKGKSNEFDASPDGIQSQCATPADNPTGTQIVNTWYQPHGHAYILLFRGYY